ncbi:MAG: peptide deformylase [Candidatus Terrybacteria bacterium]|nr:peptide deformylase [Candidatus Terrybacteria bacterium]
MKSIIQKEDKILRQIAKEAPVDEIKSKKIKDIVRKMSGALAEKENGVALAAPQIGESLRIFIIDRNVLKAEEKPKEKPEKEKRKIEPWIFINPVIKKISQKKQIVPEGCLSVEGVYGDIKRAEKLTVEAYDENAKKFTRGASGLLAQIIQHEIDHLNGVLFIDKAENLERIKNYE